MFTNRGGIRSIAPLTDKGTSRTAEGGKECGERCSVVLTVVFSYCQEGSRRRGDVGNDEEVQGALKDPVGDNHLHPSAQMCGKRCGGGGKTEVELKQLRVGRLGGERIVIVNEREKIESEFGE